ncbi:hypothetical protein BDV95DRAFT_350961 [Massariosphaeria phaeospora]|uniref:Uncharacterized protein n=1 Tax=Massariosphaeria phaeospora TaxID=100035 RepID=A0A7C8I907_9PLEO|nr:hypothetical protein BDV95DRAFT_350961 [Massariosphaeria phaeospora]
MGQENGRKKDCSTVSVKGYTFQKRKRAAAMDALEPRSYLLSFTWCLGLSCLHFLPYSSFYFYVGYLFGGVLTWDGAHGKRSCGGSSRALPREGLAAFAGTGVAWDCIAWQKFKW